MAGSQNSHRLVDYILFTPNNVPARSMLVVSYSINGLRSPAVVTGTIILARHLKMKFTDTRCSSYCQWLEDIIAVQWRHNGRDGVSNQRRLDCLLNRLFRRSSASLAFVRGIHRWPANSPHKGPVTRTMFRFDDVIIQVSFRDLKICHATVFLQYSQYNDHQMTCMISIYHEAIPTWIHGRH